MLPDTHSKHPTSVMPHCKAPVAPVQFVAGLLLTGILTGILLAGVPAALAAQGTPTGLVVRAVAKDAKIIGSGVGGARITVRDMATGEVLASGVQEGSTGDTERIMRRPHERGATIFDTRGAAGFHTTLDLERPTRVEVVAEGPLGTEHAIQRSAKTLLLIPGEDVVGEGLVLILNGFTVVIEEPTASTVPVSEPLRVVAEVTMLCGCPTQPGGLWDSEDYRITARLVRNGRVIAESPLSYAGESSTFSGSLTAPSAGEARLEVIAVDAAKSNAGMATRELRVSEGR